MQVEAKIEFISPLTNAAVRMNDRFHSPITTRAFLSGRNSLPNYNYSVGADVTQISSSKESPKLLWPCPILQDMAIFPNLRSTIDVHPMIVGHQLG